MTSSSYRDKRIKNHVKISVNEFHELDISKALEKHDFKTSLGLLGDVSYKIKKHFKITIIGHIITFYKDGIPGMTITRADYVQRHAKLTEDMRESKGL
jgi:hypothetical protein